MRSRPLVCVQPEEEVDLQLVAADATLIFAFSFARTLSTILASPDFGTAAEPGWLAPIRTPLDPDFNFERASACLYFAGEWAVCWIAAGVLLATFASGSADSTRLCGPEGALQCAGLSTAFLAAFVLAASALCAPELPPAARPCAASLFDTSCLDEPQARKGRNVKSPGEVDPGDQGQKVTPKY